MDLLFFILFLLLLVFFAVPAFHRAIRWWKLVWHEDDDVQRR